MTNLKFAVKQSHTNYRVLKVSTAGARAFKDNKAARIELGAQVRRAGGSVQFVETKHCIAEGVDLVTSTLLVTGNVDPALFVRTPTSGQLAQVLRFA